MQTFCPTGYDGCGSRQEDLQEGEAEQGQLQSLDIDLQQVAGDRTGLPWYLPVTWVCWADPQQKQQGFCSPEGVERDSEGLGLFPSRSMPSA